jgi:hypothetical protein
MISGNLSIVEPNYKELCEFIDAWGPNGNSQALEQPMRKLSFLLLDPK